jgi:hypothetical protein
MSPDDEQLSLYEVDLPATGEITFWREGVQHTLRADGSEDDPMAWSLHAEEALVAHIGRREGSWIGTTTIEPTRQVKADADWRQVVSDVLD